MKAVVTAPEQFEPKRTFVIQRWDNKLLSVQARSYYRTESTYVFTDLAYTELKVRWNRGSLMEVPPVLELDVDAVIMIADENVVGTPAPVRRSRPKRG